MKTRSASPLVLLVLVGLALPALVGCDSNSSDPPDDLTGSYTLVQVRDKALPASITVSNGVIRIDSGSLTIDKSDGTFAISLQGHFDEIPGGGFTFDVGGHGPYTRNGNSLSFTDIEELDDSFTGTAVGNDVVLDYNFGGVMLEMRVRRQST